MEHKQETSRIEAPSTVKKVSVWRVGDIATILAVTNALLFLACVLLHASGQQNFFDQSYQRDGFCLSWNDKPLIQTHILCFYSDSLMAGILLFLCYLSAQTPGIELIQMNAFGHFAHGSGHLLLWWFYKDRSSFSIPEELGINAFQRSEHLLERVAIASITVIFWYGFFRSLRAPTTHIIFHTFFQSYVSAVLIPDAFGFVYVQTFLALITSFYEFRRVDKDAAYDLGAVLVAIPVGCMAWMEALTCDSMLRGVRGHLWYDNTIALSLLAYYAAIKGHARVEKASKAE
jgi:hypothetical protein